MLEKFHDDLPANDHILFFDEGLVKSYFLLMKLVFLVKILIKLIVMMIIIFMKMILIVLFMSDLAWCNKFEKCKALKKDRLMSAAWHVTRCWDWCLPVDEKIGAEPILTEKC